MDHSYARNKLELLLRDLDMYNDGEFWRQMSRIAYGATTGHPNPEELSKELDSAEATITDMTIEMDRVNDKLSAVTIRNNTVVKGVKSIIGSLKDYEEYYIVEKDDVAKFEQLINKRSGA